MSNSIIAYDRNKPYNNLPLLPPNDDQVETKEVLKALNNANKALAELKGIARKLPNQSMLVNTIALREAKASTEIENIFTTEDELYKTLTISEYRLKGNAKEVLRYRQALWKGYNDIGKNMLMAIEQTSKYTISKIEEIDRLFSRTTELVNEKYPSIRKEFIEKLFEQPYVSPRKLLDNNIKSLNTAKKYLKQLERIGVLVSEKIGKEIVYLNIDLYNILAES